MEIMENKNLFLLFRTFVFCFILMPGFVLHPKQSQAQSGVAINASGAACDSSAILDVSATNKGMLMPRMTTAQRNGIVNPAEGLLIFNTTIKCFEAFVNSAWLTVSCPANCTPPATPGSITGNSAPCLNGTGLPYSIATVSGATYYTWTVPSGATITGGQGSNAIVAGFGTTNGNICVTASNNCGTSSPACLSITLQSAPSAPTSGAQVPGQTQIAWNWNAVAGATGYKWNTTNNYGTATDNGAGTSYTQTGLTCNTAYNLYIWAYNSCGNSTETLLSQTTSACVAGKRVFMTSTTYTANFGGVTGADNQCQLRANAASLGGSWKAWISQSGNSPSTRFTQYSGPYILLNSNVVANSWADLTDGTIGTPINIDEYNNLVTSSVNTWTNTNIDGTFNTGSLFGCGGTVCGSWTIGNTCNNPNCAQLGGGTSVDFNWTVGGASCCDQLFRLYCFEQ
jgi:hypothetical protein